MSNIVAIFMKGTSLQEQNHGGIKCRIWIGM